MKRRDFVSLVSAAMGTSVLWSCKKDWNETQVASDMEMMTARGGGTVRFRQRIDNVLAHFNPLAIRTGAVGLPEQVDDFGFFAIF